MIGPTLEALVWADVGVIIVSVFCAGGLFAYLREALRLRRLLSSGRTALATIVDTRADDSGSESIVHYLVTYEFVDEEGRTVVHEQDLNSRAFFDSLRKGDTLDVLYETGPTGNSYPATQIRSDQKLSWAVAVAILVFWAAMVVFLVRG